MRLVSVAVPVPAVEALTYRVPDQLPDPVPGARVLVPLGTRVLTGVVLADAATPDLASPAPDPDVGIKDVIDVLDEQAFLPPDVLRLVSWVAEYYACGAGEALASAMPPRAWIESERFARVTSRGRERRSVEKGLRAEILAKLPDDRPA